MGVRLTRLPPWRSLNASVRGASHHATDTPCQDYSLVEPLSTPQGEPILVLVAADGAGSAAQAAIGARLACGTLVEVVLSYIQVGGTLPALTREDVEAWISHIANRLSTYAHAEELELRDLASTLLAAVVGTSAVAYLQIGDGAIVIGQNDIYRPIFWPQSGEYANTTFFLTDDSPADHLDFELSFDLPNEIALLTDGLQMLALTYATKEAHAPFFRPLFARLRDEPEHHIDDLKDALVAWLDSPQINARTDDDKTLVLIARPKSS